jgi:hypothetical protein
MRLEVIGRITMRSQQLLAILGARFSSLNPRYLQDRDCPIAVSILAAFRPIPRFERHSVIVLVVPPAASSA